MAIALGEIVANCDLLVHGSTVATNTILEHAGARVGLLVTEGFRDSLEIRRGARENPWDHRTPYPPVLVPRYLTPSKRGRKPAERNPLSAKVHKLEAKVARLEKELHTAHTILDVQGKVAGLLGFSLEHGKDC